MTNAPTRIWAWPHFDGWITGDWSANTYHDDRTVEYILATEHARLMAERDAFHIEMDRLQTKAMGAVDAARAIEADYVRLLAKKDSALLRCASSLAAAISLLERGGKAAKKAAPSDKMFDQMILDYKAALELALAALKGDDHG